MKSEKQAAFTLLELLIVLLIIGLLAAFVGPKYFGQIGKSQAQVAKAQIEAFDKALDQYRLDTGKYPTTAQGLDALFAAPANEANWKGPYLKKAVPLDPWGNRYQYTSPGTQPNSDFEILSLGRDGRLGGSGEDADISSW
ncbi:MAG: type II secretion system major pseudopilin GspG [Rhodocyclaceae bacterium]|nr:type II secretion system major pseudopilin GspG [Rhodocyclaceae bacterium]